MEFVYNTVIDPKIEPLVNIVCGHSITSDVSSKMVRPSPKVIELKQTLTPIHSSHL